MTPGLQGVQNSTVFRTLRCVCGGVVFIYIFLFFYREIYFRRDRLSGLRSPKEMAAQPACAYCVRSKEHIPMPLRNTFQPSRYTERIPHPYTRCAHMVAHSV